MSMKKAKINNLIGIGEAQIFGTNGLKECNGYFEAEFNTENADILKSYHGREKIIYSGVVIDQGNEKDLSFPIIIKTQRLGEVIRIEFAAAGNLYDS